MKLTAENICKTIKDRQILSHINLTLESSTIYGFTGKNGSGKTMLFRALSGLMNIDSGTISWNNQILHKDISILPKLGLTLENAGLYPEYTGFQNLKMLAQIKKTATDRDIKSAIQRVGLDPDDKRTYQKYSLGMKQRIIIAQAIMEKPDIIMLDEPGNGLDESGIELIRQLILEEQKRGALILLASHNKDDIQLLSNHTFFMDQGSLIKGAIQP
ncbi:MAG: ABC transporter ATP-binding protein [Lachnospiraceae bacterium]|nr:ABC transporter ATP-binding protein [Lachnospiraceae bacterium]